MTSIVRARPLGEQIADVLRREIVTGVLTEGEVLTEESVAVRFETSRGPVRDALKRLANQHLVDRSARSYRVIGMGQDDIDDVYQIRQALEQIAWTVAAETDGPAAAAALAEPMEQMQTAAGSGDANAFAAADVDFHAAVVSWTGRRRLIGMWRLLDPSIRMMLAVTNQIDEDLHEVYERHADLVEALTVCDSPRLTELLDNHLGNSRRKIALPG